MTVVTPRRSLPPDLAALFPFEPHWTTLADGTRLHHVERGSGEPVVLVHGNPTWSFVYRKFLPPLAAAGFRAVAFDHAGFGLSDHPERADYHSVERHVSNMEAWAEANGVRDATLVVHDWGGPIGLGWAGRHPDLVKRIVILNTLAWAPRRARPVSAFHRVFASPAGKLLGQDLNLLVEVAMRFGVAKPLPRDVLRAYRFPFPTSASRAAPLRLARMVPSGPDHWGAPAIRAVEEGFAKLRGKPTLVVWGDRDPVFGAKRAERWRESLDVREVVHLPDAAHFLQEDAPDAIVEAMRRFLAA